MKVRFRILPISRDLRTYEQQAAHLVREAELAAAPIESLWRDRVAANVGRRQAAITEGVSIEHRSNSRAA